MSSLKYAGSSPVDKQVDKGGSVAEKENTHSGEAKIAG
jgi:hypothetical protein